MLYDVVIIGAGVCGCAVARELARYQAKICVVEKEEDVCCGTSKANSALVHAGFDAKPGTWKAKMNVEGSRLMEQTAQELDFPYLPTGALVVCTDEAARPGLDRLLEQGRRNGVEGLSIVEGEALWAMEPNLSRQAVAALLAQTAAMVDPFEMTLAYGENASVNGAEFRFDTEVTAIQREQEGYTLRLQARDGAEQTLTARMVVNAAGVYADVLHNMVSEKKLHITPRRGAYLLLDKTAGGHVSRTIFALPGPMGKGVLVTPTTGGNLLVGPTAEDIENKRGTDTTAAALAEIAEKAEQTVRDIPLRQVITSFAGLRAHEDGDDFVLGEPEDAPGFVDCAGIESPGLSSAPAIGRWTAGLIRDRLGLEEKRDFQPRRIGPKRLASLPLEERNRLIRENPAYGAIVCRCETLSEGEILDAIHRPLGAKSLDGVKRRTRAGMGRCQGGFCGPRVMELLARELGVPMTELTKSGGASRLLAGRTKEVTE